MRFRDLRLAALALLAAGAMGGCGSSSGNGVASKPAQQILNAASNAAHSAHSVHVNGSASSAGQALQLDLNLVNGKGASGTISTSGFTVDVIDIANTVYLKGSNSFWQQFGGKGAAQLFSGRWLKSPATGNFATFAQFTDLKQLFDRIFSNHGSLTKGAATTVRGQQAIPLHDARGGDLYVATTGKPYPVELVKSGAGGGKVYFSDYDHPFSLAAPPNAVDISKFRG
jgi:hypothetical protein